MQVSNSNNLYFTSVIPVRVVGNDGIIRDQKVCKKTCECITKILAGPSQNQAQHDFVSMLSLKDPDFSARRAIKGYCGKDETPSNYFKIVFDSETNPYILTGKESEELSRLGRNIGVAQRDCNMRGVSISDALLYAKEQYNRAVKAILSAPSRRIKDEFTTISKQKVGDENIVTAFVGVTPRKKDPTKFDLVLKTLDITKLLDK